jgi:Zn-dependent protease
LLFNLTPELLIANLIALGIGMTFHEFAHNYVGYLMGDPVPKREGRLTLNPLVHINWIGWLMFAVIGFGILGSAPISPYRMRNPRWGFLAAVAAGPLSNLAIAIILGLFLRILNPADMRFVAFVPFGGGRTTSMGDILILILVTTVYFNIILFLFNLIPLFPLDGWHIVLALLPPDLAYTWQRYQQISQYVFLGLILLSFVGVFNILGALIQEPAIRLYFGLLGIRVSF